MPTKCKITRWNDQSLSNIFLFEQMPRFLARELMLLIFPKTFQPWLRNFFCQQLVSPSSHRAIQRNRHGCVFLIALQFKSTKTTLETQSLWPLLTNGRCSEVALCYKNLNWDLKLVFKIGVFCRQVAISLGLIIFVLANQGKHS